MKTPNQTRSGHNRGTTLSVALVITAILGLLLASFLKLLLHSNYGTARSQVWNTAIPVAEAGIEDALTHLNIHGATNLACDGWQRLGATTVFWKEHALGNDFYLVTISNTVAMPSTNNRPVVESRAYLKPPLGLAETAWIVRGVRVTTRQVNALCKGMISKGSLQFQSVGNIVVDSYNSSSPLGSTDGRYDPAKRRPNGFMGSNSRVSGDMQVQGTLQVLGTIGTGASGVLTMQSPASVGDQAWVTNPSNAGKVQSGHHDSNLNLPFADVPVPFNSGFFAPASGSCLGTNYTYLLTGTGTKYRTDKIGLLDSSKKMLVTGDVTLYVTDTLEMDCGQIIIAPNAKLTLYVEKAFVAKGTAAINANGVPAQFFYYGRPNNTSFQVMDNAQLVGVFYAPQANGQFQGNSGLCGGGSFNSLQMQHTFKFHYDEALGGASDRLFFASSWNEMARMEVQTLPTGLGYQVSSP